jgi:hypothetical protein
MVDDLLNCVAESAWQIKRGKAIMSEIFVRSDGGGLLEMNFKMLFLTCY